MAVIISNEQHEIRGLVTTSYQEDPNLKLSTRDFRKRKFGEVLAIVLHTTQGKREQRVIDQAAPESALRGRRVVLSWARDDRQAGAHLIVDADGSVLCLADLAEIATFHAGVANERTIGIEIAQQPDGAVYRAQLVSTVMLCAWLSDHFGIPRRACYPYTGVRAGIELERGTYGHRDCSNNRGWGDPGDAVVEALLKDGWTAF